MVSLHIYPHPLSRVKDDRRVERAIARGREEELHADPVGSTVSVCREIESEVLGQNAKIGSLALSNRALTPEAEIVSVRSVEPGVGAGGIVCQH